MTCRPAGSAPSSTSSTTTSRRASRTSATIRSSGKLEKDTIDALVAAVQEFKAVFVEAERKRAAQAELPPEPELAAGGDHAQSTPGNPLV
jgi:hypothetical protein